MSKLIKFLKIRNYCLVFSFSAKYMFWDKYTHFVEKQAMFLLALLVEFIEKSAVQSCLPNFHEISGCLL